MSDLSTIEQKFRKSFDREYQYKLLRLLYKDKALRQKYRFKLSSNHFSDQALKWLATQIFAAHDTGDRPSRSRMKKDLKKCVVDYGTITRDEAPKYKKLVRNLSDTVADANQVKEDLHKFITHATLVGGLRKAVHSFKNDDSEVAAQALEDAAEELKKSRSVVLLDANKVSEKLSSFLETPPEPPLFAVPTNIRGYDNSCNDGGVPWKKLAALVAETGGGKTTFLTSFGMAGQRYFDELYHQTNGELDLHVAHLTGEDDEEEVFFGYMQLATRRSKRWLRNKANHSEAKRLLKKAEKVRGKWDRRLILHEFESQTIRISDIEAMLDQLEAEGKKVGLLIVDYADLVIPNKVQRWHQGWDVIGQVYTELQEMAKRRGIVVWTASQMNREGLARRGKRSGLEHVGGAVKKAEKVDTMLFFEQTQEENQSGIGRIIVKKRRFGPKNDEYKVKVDFSRGLFKELDG